MNHFRYAVTDRAWRSMKDMNTDQCLIFTGESGSGKTEAMKLSLQYLAAITGHPREFHLTKFQILQSNIVLESFGNAKTRANDNSSRFGKFMEVSFDFKGDPTGAHITNCKSTTLYVFWRSLTILSTFASFRCRFAWKGKCGCSEEETQEEIRLLLNRMYILLMHISTLLQSRVTRRYPRGERNFHIFYQLLAGADIQLLSKSANFIVSLIHNQYWSTTTTV